MDIIKQLAQYFTSPSYIISKLKTEDGIDGHMIAYTDKDSIISEEYRVLRTNLYSLSPEKPLKSIVITSAQSQEGKTITACNLCYTLSLDVEKKTLLIDCDLRRAAVHKMFGIARKPGFSDIMSGKVDIEHFLAKPAFGNLYVIPSGSIVDNPAELLGSAKIKNLIEMLKTKFDYIVFDAPPVINVTDSSILGSICDGVIFIIKAGVTPKDIIEEAFNMLKRAQAEPRACILTNVTTPMHKYYLSKYRYYERYRYGHKRTKR